MSLTSHSVSGLITLARGGDKDALDELLSRARSYLTVLARIQTDRRLRGKVDPSDIVQDVLCASFRGFPDFRGDNEPALLAWIRQILAHQIIDQLRRYQLSQKRDMSLERACLDDLEESSLRLATDLVQPGPDPSLLAEQREQSLLLADALERLPPLYRDVLIDRHIQGLKFAEIAEKSQRAVSTIEKRWMNAIQALRRQMKSVEE